VSISRARSASVEGETRTNLVHDGLGDQEEMGRLRGVGPVKVAVILMLRNMLAVREKKRSHVDALSIDSLASTATVTRARLPSPPLLHSISTVANEAACRQKFRDPPVHCQSKGTPESRASVLSTIQQQQQHKEVVCGLQPPTRELPSLHRGSSRRFFFSRAEM
jgi:hypothetical protein